MPFTEYAKESEAEEHEFQMEAEEERLREAEAVLELRRQRSVISKKAVLDQWSANLKSCIAQAEDPNRQAQSKFCIESGQQFQ